MMTATESYSNSDVAIYRELWRLTVRIGTLLPLLLSLPVL